MASATGLPDPMSSLRTRFSAAFTITCLFLVGANALTVLHFSDQNERRQIDQLVLDEMDTLIEQYQRHEVAGLPHGTQLLPTRVRGEGTHLEFRKWFRVGWLTQRFVVRSAAERDSLPEELRLLSPGFHDVVANGHVFRVEVRETGGAYFYLAYDTLHHDQRLQRFQWAVVASAAAAGVVAVLVGLWLSASLTRQVADLARRVNNRGADAGDDRLAAHYEDREVNALAQAFDHFQARMASLLAREKALTADVSHELRTPLTAIRTSSELLLADASLPSRCRERVEKIARAATRLGELISGMLLLARDEAAPATTETVLLDCLAEAIDPLSDRIAAKGLRIDIDVPAGHRVLAPRNALSVVLSNLIINAVSYTDSGSILIRSHGNLIEVTDTGKGIDPDDVPAMFQRFRRGQGERADGYGLGLAIVKRICDQLGWQIVIENRPEGGGARVLLTVGPDLIKTAI